LRNPNSQNLQVSKVRTASLLHWRTRVFVFVSDISTNYKNRPGEPLPWEVKAKEEAAQLDGFNNVQSRRVAYSEIRRIKYRPLQGPKEIRLVTLHPARLVDPVRISIDYYHLDRPTRGSASFEALSYVWGDPTIVTPAYWNGNAIDITENLFRCLQRLRYTKSDRRLWIDALCINQEDMAERGQQVALMRSIYSSASNVLAWIGEEDKNTLEGMIALESLAMHWDNRKVDMRALLVSSEGLRASATKLWALMRKEKVASVVDRDWFKRAWTFQEICLSYKAEICCGRYTLPWKVMVNAWLKALELEVESTLFVAKSSTRKCIHSLFAYWLLLNNQCTTEQDKWCSLSRVLHLNQLRGAADARDRIFSLLALAQSNRGEPYPVDYRLTAAEVFTQYARRMIQEDNHLAILSDCERVNRSRNLPSWAPDWSKSPATKPLSGPGVETESIYMLTKTLTSALSYPQVRMPRSLAYKGPSSMRLYQSTL
jgi:hypothetical protein